MRCSNRLTRWRVRRAAIRRGRSRTSFRPGRSQSFTRRGRRRRRAPRNSRCPWISRARRPSVCRQAFRATVFRTASSLPAGASVKRRCAASRTPTKRPRTGTSGTHREIDRDRAWGKLLTLDTLNNLIPVIAILGIATFMTLERWMPYFEHGVSRGTQRRRNLGIVAIGFAMNAVLGTAVALPVMWADAHRFGLMYRLNVWPPLAIVIGVFLIDLYNYAQHVTSHYVPALWRIHRVHHADTELDATSGLRTHPIELLLLLFIPALILPF